MRRTFTLAETIALLPLVKAIALEVIERRQTRRRLQQQRYEMEGAATPEGLAVALSNLDAEIFAHDEGIRKAGQDLLGLGLTVLRTQPLTVHFPGRTRTGDIVFCWQEGEEGVCYGHPIGQEEDPRRPLKLRSGEA